MIILLRKLRRSSLLPEKVVCASGSREIVSGFLKVIISVQSLLNTSMLTDTVLWLPTHGYLPLH